MSIPGERLTAGPFSLLTLFQKILGKIRIRKTGVGQKKFFFAKKKS
jgi:hypothetical protein